MAQAKFVAPAAALGLFAFGYTQFAAPAAPTVDPAALKNRAFVFVKPHAATDATTTLVRDELKKKGMKIHGEGDIDSKMIDDKKLIDQHYYAIASKATIMKPEDMNVPADKFEGKFGKKWDAVLADKKAFNALDACKELGVDGAEMAKLWAGAKKAGKLIKLGGGFYCGEISHKGKTVYAFNGFFMEMRNAFTAPGKKIHYYDVEWDQSAMKWADFRGNFLGPTDPKDAPKESLRGIVLARWKELGLAAEPNVGDNAVHASASPFEGMAERMNWLGVECSRDDYCKSLLVGGIPKDIIEAWTRDPQVPVSEDKKTRKSLFDSLEDQDAGLCFENARQLAKYSA